MQAQALDPFKVAYGICNPLYGVQMVFSEDMQDAFCRALNDWLVKEWLDKDSRLRGSIVIPTQSIEKAVAEIERCAAGQALRAGADAGHGRHAARQARAMADLCRRRTARPADRHPCRLGLSQPADLGRLGLLSRRGLCRAGAGVPDPAHQPDRRGRVRPPSEAENGDAGIRLHLARAVRLAAAQVLARHPHGNALGRPPADGDCAQQHPLFAAAGRRAARFGNAASPVRPYAVGRIAPILNGLPALAIRGQRCPAGWVIIRPRAQDHDRQSARHLWPA